LVEFAIAPEFALDLASATDLEPVLVPESALVLALEFVPAPAVPEAETLFA
jgi:hypothetical protein